MVTDTTPLSIWLMWGDSYGSGGIVRSWRFDVDRGTEMTVVNMYNDVQKSDMGGGSVPGEMDGIPTVELFKESSEGVRPTGPK